MVGRWELGRKLVDVPLQTEARVGGERTVRVGEGGKSARTRFALVQQFGARASLVEATLETGRTHQIRVHAAYCGHPVAGDVKYGDAAANAALRELGLQRMFLHAHSVSFDWPQGGQVNISAPLPAELKAVLEALATLRTQARLGQRVAAGAQARGEPDQRQADEPGRIQGLDALAQTCAQSSRCAATRRNRRADRRRCRRRFRRRSACGIRPWSDRRSDR